MSLVSILLLYLCLSSSLSQFLSIFVSFVAISSVLCCCFKAMLLVRICYVTSACLFQYVISVTYFYHIL